MTFSPALWIGRAGLALALWFAALLALTAVAEPSRAVVVLGPDRTTVDAAITRAGLAFGDGGGAMATATGLEPGFVRRLYQAGAWLVLPARAGGCLGRRA